MSDNVIRRKDKKAWGFTSDENGVIKLGVPNTEQTDDMLSDNEEGGHNNGGGTFPSEENITYAFLQSLTKAKELRALAAEHNIELEAKGNTSAADIRAELAEYYEVTPE